MAHLCETQAPLNFHLHHEHPTELYYKLLQTVHIRQFERFRFSPILKNGWRWLLIMFIHIDVVTNSRKSMPRTVGILHWLIISMICRYFEMAIVSIFKKHLVLWMAVWKYILLELIPSPLKPENSSVGYPIHVCTQAAKLTTESKRAQETEEGDEEGGDNEEQREKKARKRVTSLSMYLIFRRNELKPLWWKISMPSNWKSLIWSFQ